MKSKKDRLKEARTRLDTAKKQWDKASVDAWEPAEPAECVTKCFYAYENALTAAAIAIGVKWTTKHFEKVALAKTLFKENKLKTDISDRLEELNSLRKNIQYGELGSGDEHGIDLEDLTSDLELFLNEVDALLDSFE